MSKAKNVLKIGCAGMLALSLVVAALFVAFVGPWPTYKDSGYRDSQYYKEALAAIETAAAESEITESPGTLQAGWAVVDMTPDIGVPLAGYGARPGGKQSTGVRDTLHVRALALSDGKDTAVMVGKDMLIIPPNIAQAVRDAVAAKTPLNQNDILFTASHSHCGPGGFGPGLASKVTGGDYVPSLPSFLAGRFADAICQAYGALEPARLCSEGVDAAKYIRNRTREAPIDTELSYMIVEQKDGDQCYLLSFNAHPTIFGSHMMEFSAEYPGEFMRAVEEKTGATAVYLGGAVGSASPRAPEAGTDSEKVRLLGEALAKLVTDDAASKELTFKDHLDVATVGIPLGMPPLQIRPLKPSWRLSPLASKIMQVPLEGWTQGIRVGDIFFVGMPCDLSAEISMDWKSWGESQGYDLWAHGFSGAYCGYFSPDRYYKEEDYETGLMSWFGPNMEAYATDLLHAMEASLAVEPGRTSSSAGL